MAKESVSASQAMILWIEGRWAGHPNFLPLLRKKGFNIETVSTGKSAQELTVTDSYDLVVVNAASMRTSGARICKKLREQNSRLPIILICVPDRLADDAKDLANHVLVLPFTTRKLVNRIMPLLPIDQRKVKEFGSIMVDVERNRVNYNGRQTTLTPKLMRLLEILIDKRGQVITRDELFKTVWKTDYTGDTRTLDVHISWLRQAIEEDPRNPVTLKTVRGVGYRLDVK